MASGTEHVRIPVPTCPIHKLDELFYYCRTCHLRVCEKCVKGEHAGHDWTNIKNYAKQLRMEGQQIADKLRREVIAPLKAKWSRPNVENWKAKVRDAQKRMKSLIDEHADDLVQQLEGDEDVTEIEKYIQEIEELALFFERNVQIEYDNVVVETEEELQTKLRRHGALQTRSSDIVRRFQEGTINQDVIKAMLGRVVEDKPDQSTSKLDVTVETTIQHGPWAILGISAVSEKNAWIRSKFSQKTSLIDTNGKEIGATNYGTVLNDFIVQGEDQIFTLMKRKSINRISKGKIKEICSTSPLHPTGICHARDGGMLVCLVDCLRSDITSSTKGEVHHMDMEGRIKRKYHQDESDHTKLFTYPCRVATNINSDLCVCDILDNEWRSRLVVVTEDSRVRFTYTGQTSLKEIFTVRGVVCDSYGRIILSDCFNHAVHMLSADGKFVQYLLTSQSGLRGPTSLALCGDSMWVGCYNGVIKICKLKEQS